MLDNEALLSFLYQTPYGIISSDGEGEIDMMNAFASQILLPIIPANDYNNVFVLLDMIIPDFTQSSQLFNDGPDYQSSEYRVKVSHKANRQRYSWLDLKINKLNPNQWMIGLTDSTKRVEQQALAKIEAAKKAHHQARLEMVINVIHDIGNAITPIGITAELTQNQQWSEITHLQKTKELLTTHIPDLNSLLGENKGSALITLIANISDSLEVKKAYYTDSSKNIVHNVNHIKDIITAQRQFAFSKNNNQSMPLHVSTVIHNAITIIEKQLNAGNIRCSVDQVNPYITIMGDKTQLTQMMVNGLKNASEAISLCKKPHNGEIIIKVAQTIDCMIDITIQDNGIGFDQIEKDKIEQGHYSSKKTGTGIGLKSCKSIIASHGGTVDLLSKGRTLGSQLRIKLPERKEQIL